MALGLARNTSAEVSQRLHRRRTEDDWDHATDTGGLMPKLMVGYAKCNACGYVAIVECFGRKLVCPQCGRRNVTVNPEEETQASLADFQATV